MYLVCETNIGCLSDHIGLRVGNNSLWMYSNICESEFRAIYPACLTSGSVVFMISQDIWVDAAVQSKQAKAEIEYRHLVKSYTVLLDTVKRILFISYNYQEGCFKSC